MMQTDDPDVEYHHQTLAGQPISDHHGQHRRRNSALIALSIVLVFSTLVALQTPLAQRLIAVTPTAQRPLPVASQLTLAIATNVNYGQLTMNGKSVTFRPYDPSRLITLSLPHYTLTLAAPPFRAISCTIDTLLLPFATSGGKCHPVNGTYYVDSVKIFVIDMNFMQTDLAADQQGHLQAALQQAFARINSIQTVVNAGDHYATGLDTQLIPISAVAQTPLHAQVMAQLITGNANNECIAGLCPGGESDLLSLSELNVPAVVFSMQIALGWSFFDMAGSSVGTFLPQPSGGGNGPPVYTTSSIELRFVLTASGWQIDTTDFQDSPLLGFVSSQLANQFCSDSADVTTAWVEQATGKVGGYGLPLRPLLDGCFFTTNSNGGSDPQQIDPLTDTQSTWYLEHFGALLAVNDMAHAMFPQLPRATAEEVHTLRQSETSAP